VLKHKSLTITIDDPNDKQFNPKDPDTDSDKEDGPAPMGDLGKLTLNKALSQNGLTIAKQDEPQACCVMF